MSEHGDRLSVNYGVTAGTINGPVQNNPFGTGNVQVNHAPAGQADPIAAVRERAGRLRRDLDGLARAGDRDAAIALEDLTVLLDRLGAPQIDHRALEAAADRLYHRCAVIGTEVSAAPLRETIRAVTGNRRVD
ncbi:hypothetical protein ACQEU5_03725 [Marinactinospora thermotolerans]|uniref:Uncharacterized protein n=1 Tax=Marinactinospora thermotolerans DSM 45154 TaxID=1122192 RepID=A0A1T4TBK0_9ACTN|nr:hypothetical protein [Marinactinospora thermotolerans]SKA37950.1 hypothetical protein SAMN02745673_04763 [Marinactinospora thermotolerans DSM 45154]